MDTSSFFTEFSEIIPTSFNAIDLDTTNNTVNNTENNIENKLNRAIDVNSGIQTKIELNSALRSIYSFFYFINLRFENNIISGKEDKLEHFVMNRIYLRNGLITAFHGDSDSIMNVHQEKDLLEIADRGEILTVEGWKRVILLHSDMDQLSMNFSDIQFLNGKNPLIEDPNRYRFVIEAFSSIVSFKTIDSSVSFEINYSSNSNQSNQFNETTKLIESKNSTIKQITRREFSFMIETGLNNLFIKSSNYQWPFQRQLIIDFMFGVRIIRILHLHVEIVDDNDEIFNQNLPTQLAHSIQNWIQFRNINTEITPPIQSSFQTHFSPKEMRSLSNLEKMFSIPQINHELPFFFQPIKEFLGRYASYTFMSQNKKELIFDPFRKMNSQQKYFRNSHQIKICNLNHL